MTAASFALRRASLGRSALIGAGLSGAIFARWAAAPGSTAEVLVVGLAFGGSLLVLGLAGGWRPSAPFGYAQTPPHGERILRRAMGPLVAGLAAGVALVALAALVRPEELPGLRPAVPFLPWVLVTTLVATSEEIVLRGALFDALERSRGPILAVVFTSVAFALMHVPFYGWHVVPLDLAVGLLLAGVRLSTGGVAAPAIAHTLADVATWWL